MSDAATNTGAVETPKLTVDGELSDNGEAAFLSHYLKQDKDAETPPEGDEKKADSEKSEPEGDTEETSDESPEEEGETEGDEKTDDTDEKSGDKKTFVEDEGVYTKIKVGDEELEVPVKDLKRLYGQEAALTRRSQEVAKQRDSVTQAQQQYAAGLQMLAQRAEQRANEFRQLDFMALARNPDIDPQQLEAARAEAEVALQEERFFKEELGQVAQHMQQEQQKLLAGRALHTVKELGDPASPYHIEDWGEAKYNEILKFAVDNGVEPAIANALVDAPAFKLLHMAQMYAKGRSVTTKVVNKTGKKIVKSSSASQKSGSTVKSASKNKAMDKLRASGAQDDAADAFLASFEDNS